MAIVWFWTVMWLPWQFPLPINLAEDYDGDGFDDVTGEPVAGGSDDTDQDGFGGVEEMFGIEINVLESVPMNSEPICG